MDREKAIRNLESIIDKLHTDSDISQLQEYYKLFKKEISLFKRSLAAAWLFRYFDQRETPNIIKTQSSEKPLNAKNKKKIIPEEKPAADNILTDEESKRLFFSIGKNRRLFPREVITLIMSKTTAAREDIGLIRILDNYSFVQVRETKAGEIIDNLTGLKFRGRTLTVNYAKPKSGDE